ncbi:MAG: patatin-like phospholipase family protein, partial [Acidobacteria bacterium]|nr:patatin-like phospholipase family protein [Acidobacteriota bacterium]MCA1642247.1 patatin-like phospholipase family protein [Acidobacteriota bacterium]
MLTRSRSLPLALLVVALPLCADLFTTAARRAPQAAPAAARVAAKPSASPTATPSASPTAQPTPSPTPSEPLVIRVGVVNFNGSESSYAEHDRVLSEMAKGEANPKISFRLVDGTYDDVLAWYQNGLLDVAVLSPGIVAQLLSKPEWKKQLQDNYIASEALKPVRANNIFASKQRRAERGEQFLYGAAVVVGKDAPVNTYEDLVREAEQDNVKMLYVHPLSVSGHILPRYVIEKELKIKNAENLGVEWTYDHGYSLRLLNEPDPDDTRIKVAVVMDDAKAPGDAEGAGFNYGDYYKKVEFPGLDNPDKLIPQDIVVLHPNFSEHRETVKRLFLKSGLGKTYRERKGWVDEYARVEGWLSALALPLNEMAQQYLSLEQIIGKIRYMKTARPEQTRLALVLSGGGAKCAYQLGVIQALEEELAVHEKPGGKRDVDIDLVVGTSGGAINALSVGLGITESDEGVTKLKETWEGFTQRSFFTPWGWFQPLLGTTLGLLQAIAAILAVRLFAREKINWQRRVGLISVILIALGLLLWYAGWRTVAMIPLITLPILLASRLFNNPSKNWWRHAGWAMIALGVVEMTVALTQWTPWERMKYVAAALLAAAQLVVIVVAARIYHSNQEDSDSLRWWKISLVIFAALVGAEVLVASLGGGDSWEALEQSGKNHVLHHLWLLLTLGLYGAAAALLVVGAGLLYVGAHDLPSLRPWGYYVFPGSKKMRVFRLLLLRRLSVATAAVATLLVAYSLLHNNTLSDSQGIEKIMSERFPELLATVRGEFKPGDGDPGARLRHLSQEIIANDWLKHDLVITSMRLPTEDDRRKAQPACSDCYFFYDHVDEIQKTPGGERFRSPADQPLRDPRFLPFKTDYGDRLMDVVIGSSSIFPVFPPRELASLGAPETLDKLIDGGFAHNSPIEAAVAWGATHIILVEASPAEEPQAPGQSLLANSVTALNYLFSQAQLVDARSRGKVEIYSIRPQPPHVDDRAAQPPSEIENPCARKTTTVKKEVSVAGANLCTFDFTKELVGSAIRLGRTDANK